MTGMFGYNDSLIGTGAITGTSLDSFMIEVFQNATSLGTWQPSNGGTFNFNFNTTTEAFLVGGSSTSLTGQIWGSNSSTVGFASGNAGQSLFLSGSQIVASFLPVGSSTLTATRKATVTTPEPGTILGLVAVGAGLVASKRKKQG